MAYLMVEAGRVWRISRSGGNHFQELKPPLLNWPNSFFSNRNGFPPEAELPAMTRADRKGEVK